ncbi:MAG: methyltransferase [Rhizonema sp. NSF051]|nr:methyltransferase [Rhizonema sp. NSF051]
MAYNKLQRNVFDELCVLTDSLNSLSFDSVFPIFEEEQLFLCQQMRPIIEQFRHDQASDLNILDVGTGSGILAIFLEHVFARQEGVPHSYTIRALDRSKRAVKLAQINCRINRCQHVQVLPAQSYFERSVEVLSQDLILMNPPFNPTYPTFIRGGSTAINGYTGLRVFREWLHYLPQHLGSDGMVIGFIMSPIAQNKIMALEELKAALGTEFCVRYCRSLPEDYDTFEFLNAIYQHYLSASTPEEHDSLAIWIERIAMSAHKLALIYYEASRRSQAQTIKEIEPIWQPQASWDDRIRIHQTVVDNYRKSSL